MVTSPDALSWGFLGTGSIASTVAGEVRESGAGRLTTVVSRDRARAEAFAKEFGFSTVVTDARDMFASADIDAVYIALPHALHVEAILTALDAGKHVLCEKPLGMSAEEIQTVVAHPRSASLIVAEGFMVRHHPQWLWIEEQIAAGTIGDVGAVQCLTALPFPQRAPPPTRGEGSLLLDIGCYAVHIARTIFRREPTQVSATCKYDRTGVRDVDFTALLSFPEGSAQILNSASLYYSGRYQILGTRGNIEVFNPVKPAQDGTTTLGVVTDKGGRQTMSFPPARQYALQFANFTSAVRTRSTPRITLGNSLGNARCIDAIRASAAAAGTPILL